MSQFKVRYYLVKLKLLEMGDITGAQDLQDMLQPSLLDSEEDGGKNASTSRSSGAISLDAEQTLRLYEQRYVAYATSIANKQRVKIPQPGSSNHHNNKNSYTTSSILKPRAVDPYLRDLQAEVIDVFQKAALGVKCCENCGAHTAPLRKDQYTKIFQKPMPKRLRNIMVAKKMKLKVASDRRIFLLMLVRI